MMFSDKDEAKRAEQVEAPSTAERRRAARAAGDAEAPTEPQDGPGAARAAQPEPATEAAEEEPQQLDNGVTFYARTWKGIPNYVCPVCTFASMEIGELAAFQTTTCQRPACPVPKLRAHPTGLLNERGEPLIRLEE